ncbi:MAG: ATP-binding protein [Chloroflexota bacterium]|nr:ATP-binding protein [Chloroflexota bacterium]
MEKRKLGLWRLFIIGRTAWTAVFFTLLTVLNPFPPPPALRSLYCAAAFHLSINGVYFYLWKQRDVAFLGYLCFGVEIAITTLIILFLGTDGYTFALAYLWPIIMGAWLIGHRAVLPLTLFSSIAYVCLFFLGRRDVISAQRLLMPDGTPQVLVLGLPYLFFVALLIYGFASEAERSEETLRDRNRELRSLNEKMHSLVIAGEDMLGRLNLEALLSLAVLHIERNTGYDCAAVYIKDGDVLRLRHRHGCPDRLAVQEVRPVPREWLPSASGTTNVIIREPSSGGASFTHVALRSRGGLEGMLTLCSTEGAPSSFHEMQALRILSHQLGVALENGRLFSNLGRERDLLRGILLNMTEGVFVVDEEDHVLLFNHAAQRLLDIEKNATVPAWFLEQLEEYREQSREAGMHPLVEHGGRSFRLSTVTLSETDRVPAGTLYVARDTTKEAEIERMKSDFVAYASHELRTPLTTIKTLVRLLLMDPPESTKRREYLTMIDAQTERQIHLIENLLDLARLEAGKYELSREPVDANQLVRSVVDGCLPLAEQKGLHITIKGVESGEFISNRGGLEQVLTNLLSNAIKFTDAGGEITLTHEKEGNEVIFSVRDSGVGMTEEQMGYIFDKFYTVRPPCRRGEGTGLGLAISNMIVNKLGGSIEVDSEPGVGSCFVVRLPTAHQPQFT